MAYKIAFFGAKPYDIASFDKVNEKYNYDIRYYKGHLVWLFSSSSGTCRTDPEGGYHCSRKELWLRFVKRTGTGDHQGNGCAVCDRQIICKDLFP